MKYIRLVGEGDGEIPDYPVALAHCLNAMP